MLFPLLWRWLDIVGEFPAGRETSQLSFSDWFWCLSESDGGIHEAYPRLINYSKWTTASMEFDILQFMMTMTAANELTWMIRDQKALDEKATKKCCINFHNFLFEQSNPWRLKFRPASGHWNGPIILFHIYHPYNHIIIIFLLAIVCIDNDDLLCWQKFVFFVLLWQRQKNDSFTVRINGWTSREKINFFHCHN